MRTAGVSKTAVWRWQERFMGEGAEGFFAKLTRRWPNRGVFPSIADLRAGINREIRSTSDLRDPAYPIVNILSLLIKAGVNRHADLSWLIITGKLEQDDQ